MLKSFFKLWKSKRLNDINSSDVFFELLDRERSRSDRDKGIFSVVLFEITFKKDKFLIVNNFIELLKNRGIRNTDDIGWYDEKTIGVIMHNTTSSGAQGFANNLGEEFDNFVTNGKDLLRFKVYTYPGDWLNINGTVKNNGSLRDENAFYKNKEITPEEININRNKKNNNLQEVNRQQYVVKNDTYPLRVETLENIFIRRPSVIKRSIDIIGAIIALVVFSPSMIIVAIAIKLNSKGPVFFKQKRAGIGGTSFDFYKFRSMVVDAEKQKEHLWKLNEKTGPVFKITNDPRVTKVGKVIRRWSLDELPQFYNVLIGDLSLVGPRPPTICETPKYNKWHNRRLEITPGITCLWQAYARHNKCFDTWVRMDIEYVQKNSLMLDLKILLKTIPAIISGDGAH